MQPPMHDFRRMGCMQLFYYDRLRCEGKGIMKDMLHEVHRQCTSCSVRSLQWAWRP